MGKNFCGDRKLWRHWYLGNEVLRKMWHDDFRNCFNYWWLLDNKKWNYPSCQIVTVIFPSICLVKKTQKPFKKWIFQASNKNSEKTKRKTLIRWPLRINDSRCRIIETKCNPLIEWPSKIMAATVELKKALV